MNRPRYIRLESVSNAIDRHTLDVLCILNSGKIDFSHRMPFKKIDDLEWYSQLSEVDKDKLFNVIFEKGKLYKDAHSKLMDLFLTPTRMKVE